MTRTLEQIRKEGLAALRQQLGRSGMVRFLQQFENGNGDYSSERRSWVDQTSLNDIKALAMKRNSRKRTKRK